MTMIKEYLSLTVTQLMHYAECPYRYRLLYRLGWKPGGETEREDSAISAEPGISAQTLGSIVHRVLELADFAHLESSARAILKKYFPDLRREHKDEVMRLVGNWEKSSLFQEALAASTVFRERSFILSFDQTFLEGSIDLLLLSKNKKITVLDYKTSGYSPQTFLEKIEEYRLQLELYLLSASQLFPEASTIHGGLMFLQEGDFIPIPMPREKEFNATLSHLIKDMKEENFSATPSKTACSRCPVRSICSYRLD